MSECYDFYKIWQYDLPYMLAISGFMKKSLVDIRNIASTLETTEDIIHLRGLS